MANNIDQKPLQPKPLLEQLPEDDLIVHAEPGLSTAQDNPKKKLTFEQQTEALRYYNEANLLRNRGELKQSLDALVKAIEIDPYYASAFIVKGDILAKLSQFDEAANAYEQAKSLTKSPQGITAIEKKIIALISQRKEVQTVLSFKGVRSEVPLELGKASITASVLLPGLGQALAGFIAKGLTFIVLSALGMALTTRGPQEPMLFWGGIILSLVVWVVSLIDIISEVNNRSR